MRTRIKASWSQVRALAMDRSKSFERRRQRRSHAKLRSTTQRRGMTANPLPRLAFLTTSTEMGQLACFSAAASLPPRSDASAPRSTVDDGDQPVRRPPRPASRPQSTSAKRPPTAKWTLAKCPLPERSACQSSGRQNRRPTSDGYPRAAGPRFTASPLSSSAGCASPAQRSPGETSAPARRR